MLLLYLYSKVLATAAADFYCKCQGFSYSAAASLNLYELRIQRKKSELLDLNSEKWFKCRIARKINQNCETNSEFREKSQNYKI